VFDIALFYGKKGITKLFNYCLYGADTQIITQHLIKF
jgi:hypothetical protein